MAVDNKEALRLAYEELNETLRSRQDSTLTVLSLLLPASLILATLSLDPDVQENARKLLPFVGAAAVPGGAALVAFLALIYWVTVWKLDDLFWTQIHSLEHELGITQGHEKMYNLVRRRLLWWVRRLLWPGILIIALVSYVWLFYRLL